MRVAADDPSTREALARYLLAMVRLVGGSAHGWFAGGQLVGVMLLERRGRPHGPGTLAAALRFVPLAVRIGLARTRWLNRYFVVTSTGGPAGPHRYLTLLAVARHAQGAGIGRAMIDAAWQDTLTR